MKSISTLAALILSLLLTTCSAPAPTDPALDESAPVTLRVIPQDARTVLVAWDAAPRAHDGYRLEWTHADGRFGVLDLAGSARTALIGEVDESGLSLELRTSGAQPVELASASWTGTMIPPAPTNPTTERIDATSLRVAWTRPADPSLTGYMLLYGGGDVDGVGVLVVGAESAEATITGIDAFKAHRVLIMSMRGARLSTPAAVTSDEEMGPRVVQNLTASSLDASSVSVRWDLPSGGTAPTGYRVAWQALVGGASGSLDTDLESATVSGLAPGVYTFSVSSLLGSQVSDPVSIAWAPARRITDLPASGQKIRIYEQASTNHSALSIDAEPGGPRTVSTSPGTPGRGQLAVFIEPVAGGDERIILGPLWAITEYDVSAGRDLTKVDPEVYISSTTFEAFSLDEWYLAAPLDQLILPGGNSAAFIFASRGIGISQGFVVRTGVAGSYHYVRVLAKMVAGSLLQGTSPDRFVELELSYQDVANIPFAKLARTPIGLASTPRR
ncbi:MAG TPA: fibronectin type III domain-containing protein [Candidatus Kapabacteria bacterium]|nr:fibronectin type III domain-containing protein [Candidatus Kapabacteria bacterium]